MLYYLMVSINATIEHKQQRISISKGDGNARNKDCDTPGSRS